MSTTISPANPQLVEPPYRLLALGAQRSWWRYHHQQQYRALKREVRACLGPGTKAGDVRRTRWLVARAGFSLAALTKLTPLERSELRRDLSVDGVTLALWAYWLILTGLAASPIIAQALDSSADPVDQATYMALGALIAALAIVTQVVDSLVLWIRARWGSPDRQLGLIARSALIARGRLDRGASTRLWVRRTMLSNVRALVVQLGRADCDAHAAAGVLADLREDADARPAWRELLLRHHRGELLDVHVQIPATRWTALGDLLPRWATVIGFGAGLLGLITAAKEILH